MDTDLAGGHNSPGSDHGLGHWAEVIAAGSLIFEKGTLVSTDSESVSPHAYAVLTSLAAVMRPTRAIAVGSTSAAMAIAMELESSAPEYSPRLHSFEIDQSDSGVQAFVRKHRPGFDFVESHTGSLFDLTPAHLREIGPFDLVWIDADSLVTRARTLRTVWPHVAAGGIVAVRNSTSPASTNPLWNAILRFAADDVETLTLPAQNAGDHPEIGLLRKRSEPVRTLTFTEEMVSATGVPVRFESIGIHEDSPLLDRATNVLHLLADPHLRAVLFAIGNGVSTVAALESQTSLTGRVLHKAIARLFALAMITRVDDRLVVDEGTFESFKDLPRTTHTPTEMARYSRDRPEFLKAIARQLSSTAWATEHHVNELCRIFDDDYATLRRELIDTGFLERDSAGSMYRARSQAHHQP